MSTLISIEQKPPAMDETFKMFQELISSAVGGMNVTNTIEGLERYPINVRYPQEYRDHPSS